MNQENKSSQHFYYVTKRKNSCDDSSARIFHCHCIHEKCRSFSTTTQQPCTRFTVNGLGYCYVHLQKYKSLRIDKKKHRLYTTKPFDEGTIIIEFDGEKLTRDELNERYGGKKPPYVTMLSENTAQDGACKRGISAFVRQRHKNTPSVNSIIERHNNNYVLITTKYIKADREIIVYNPNKLLLDNDQKNNMKLNGKVLTYYQTILNNRVPKFYKQVQQKKHALSGFDFKFKRTKVQYTQNTQNTQNTCNIKK